MTYEELGQILRDEREKKHLSINDAAAQLKINPRQIQALEDGNLESLPHKAYAKGFIRSYAQWLGLSADEINELLEIFGSSKNRNSEGAIVNLVKPKKKGRPFFYIFFMLFLICAIYFGWNYPSLLQNFNIAKLGGETVLQKADEFIALKDKTKKSDASEPEETAKKVPPPQENGDLPTENETESPVPVASSSISSNVMTTDSGAEKPEKNEPAANNEPVMPEGDEGKVSGQNKLIITAIEECWVHSNADKSDTRQFSLRKGDTFALTFAKSLELKLGNAGGVRLRYNGEDLPPPGQSGQVKVLKFPPADQ